MSVDLNAADDEQTLGALLRRLGDKPGFPALTESVMAINAIVNSEDQNIGELSATILKDIGLTTNILRVANSVAYRTATGGGITTVSRAVNVLGLETLRNIALTVVLFEQMKDRELVGEITEAILHAYMAGSISREAGKSIVPRQAEEIYTCALLHSIGRIIVFMYLPEEAVRMRELISGQGRSEDEAAVQVLGIDFLRLGQGVARQWLYPTSLVRTLQNLPPGVIERPQTAEDMLWVLSGFGNEICAALVGGAGTQPGESLSAVRERFAAVTTLSRPEMRLLVQKAFDDLKTFASTLEVRLGQSHFVRQVTAWAEAGPGGAVVSGVAVPDDAAQTPAVSDRRDHAHRILSDAIHQLSTSMVGDFVLDDILRITLETLLQAMEFQRVLLCMKDDDTGQMVARMGCGKDADRVAQKFRFSPKAEPNVFQLATTNGLDIVINDVADPKIADKIPPWYRSIVSARSFALMPMMLKRRAVALIYCDKQQANSIVIPERELTLMKSLRNQALLALKQPGTN